MKRVDVLAIAAHPDDVELICGGTLIRAHAFGRATGILDLAAGELASRGTPELRAKEAAKAAKVMGVAVRENLGFPDGGIQNTPETRAKVAVVIRRL
ncbi:MAG TPA: PIG-L family deacetylase, partial [Gemmatimonadaceae bacterium]